MKNKMHRIHLEALRSAHAAAPACLSNRQLSSEFFNARGLQMKSAVPLRDRCSGPPQGHPSPYPKYRQPLPQVVAPKPAPRARHWEASSALQLPPPHGAQVATKLAPHSSHHPRTSAAVSLLEAGYYPISY